MTHYSTFVSMAACMAVALAGFLTFGNKTQGNVLASNLSFFYQKDLLIYLEQFSGRQPHGQCGSFVSGVLASFFSRITLLADCRACRCFGLNMLTTLPLECFVCREVMLNYWFPHEPFSMNLHLIFTSSLVVTAMVLSLITCDLGAVFELVGATSACALAYILPPLCYIRLSKRSLRTLPAIACSAFGSIVMFISLIQVGLAWHSLFKKIGRLPLYRLLPRWFATKDLHKPVARFF